MLSHCYPLPGYTKFVTPTYIYCFLARHFRKGKKWRKIQCINKNTTGNYLYLQIILRTVQLVTTTTVRDSIQARANVFFAHVFAEVTLSLTHTLLQLPQKVSLHSSFFPINSKGQDIRSYLPWHPSPPVMWTEQDFQWKHTAIWDYSEKHGLEGGFSHVQLSQHTTPEKNPINNWNKYVQYEDKTMLCGVPSP